MEFNLFTCWQHFNLITRHVLELFKTQNIKQHMVGILRAFIRKSADVLRTPCLICWAVLSLFFCAVYPPSGLFQSRSLSFHQSVLSVFCWRCHADLREAAADAADAADSSLCLSEPELHGHHIRPKLSPAHYRLSEIHCSLTGEPVSCALMMGLPDQCSAVAKVFESGF